MFKVVTATYSNNNLTLDEKFGLINGQKIKVIIFDEKQDKKKSFLDFVKRNQMIFEKGYKFNREELYER